MEEKKGLWLPKDLVSNETPEWLKYWHEVAPKFDSYLEGNRAPLVERYLLHSFGIYSFVTEDFDKKTIKNSDLRPKLSIFLVETQDIMRGIIANQRHMTLAPVGLLLRTVFEIHCTYKFIVRSDVPEKWADLYDRFQIVEQIMGAKTSPSVPDPTEDELNEVATKHPEWFKVGTTRLEIDHWTAVAGMNLRKMAEAPHVNLLEEYKSLYKTQSKFTHASPLIRNLYRKGTVLKSIPEPTQSNHLALLAMSTCMKILEEACTFFGIEFPAYECCVVSQDMLEAMGQPRLDPRDFKD